MNAGREMMLDAARASKDNAEDCGARASGSRDMRARK